MRFKKCMLVMGAAMGIAGAGLGMFAAARPASAAVLVYDAKNVAEAIKTAITTADILTNEQKQLALQIINMTQMNGNALGQFLQGMQKEQRYPMDEKDGQIGVLSTKTTPQAFLDDCFPDLDMVLNGQMTAMDAYEASKKSLKALQQTNTDALRMAKATQNLADDVSASTMEALTNSQNAKGNLEAQQANTQVQAAGVMALVHGNNLLANIGSAQALQYQKELQDEAIARATMENSAKNLQNATASIDLTPVPVSTIEAMGE